MTKWRIYLDCLLLIGAGFLAMAGFITAKKPDAKKLLDKLAPYQGSIGVALLALGLWDLLDLLMHLKEVGFLRSFPSEIGGHAIPGAWKFHMFAYIFYVLGIIEILLGFLLGFGMIAARAGSKSPEMAAKGEAMQKKLAGIQVPLGLIGAVVGVLLLFIVATLPGMM